MSFDEFLNSAKGEIHIYTDGACMGNPGPGGYGVHMEAQGAVYEISSGENNTTNNRMEMLAAVTALELFAQHKKKIILFTDSQYLKNGITSWINTWKKNNWMTSGKKPVKNQDLWLKLDALNTAIKPVWKWVRGHNNNFGNERADTLARNAVISLEVLRTVGS